MAEFSIGLFETGEAEYSDFKEFISIVSGRSIVSAADWGEGRFELGLSGNLMVRFFRTQDGFHINLISTTNKDEIPPLVLALGNMPRRIPANVLERKIKGLRTVYAISYLLMTGRTDELESYLIRHPHGDIEHALLKTDEQLFFESISYGSWVVTVWTKTRAAYKALISAVSIVYERGREALLRKLEAEARLKEAQAKKEESAIARENFELIKDKTNFLLEMVDKVEHPEVREQLRRRLINAVSELLQGDIDDKKIPPRLD